MTDDKKKPEDETPKAQAEDAKPAEDLSDEELSNAAGGAAGDIEWRNVDVVSSDRIDALTTDPLLG